MSRDTQKTGIRPDVLRRRAGGLQLAIKGRIVTVVFFTALFAMTRGAERAPDYLLGGLLFLVLGLLHYA